MRPSGNLCVLVALLPVLALGCHPTCKKVCKTLLACEEVESSRINQEECEESCERQEALYEKEWEDTVLLDAFYAQNSCIVDSSCEEVAAGACYDPSLYSLKDTGLLTEGGE